MNEIILSSINSLIVRICIQNHDFLMAWAWSGATFIYLRASLLQRYNEYVYLNNRARPSDASIIY
jgi:hypothetical protein